MGWSGNRSTTTVGDDVSLRLLTFESLLTICCSVARLAFVFVRTVRWNWSVFEIVEIESLWVYA
jgi:hypothetical protein